MASLPETQVLRILPQDQIDMMIGEGVEMFSSASGPRAYLCADGEAVGLFSSASGPGGRDMHDGAATGCFSSASGPVQGPVTGLSFGS